MRKTTMFAMSTLAIGCAALGAFAAVGIGDDAPARSDARFRIVEPVMSSSGDARAETLTTGQASKRPRKGRSPRITNLITTDPVAVPANDEVVASLTCKRSQGIPLTGGAISPPSPAQVSISVLSRFSPNPPFAKSGRSYFVGVRNLDPVNAAQFRATLVCAKGITE